MEAPEGRGGSSSGSGGSRGSGSSGGGHARAGAKGSGRRCTFTDPETGQQCGGAFYAKHVCQKHYMQIYRSPYMVMQRQAAQAAEVSAEVRSICDSGGERENRQV